MTPAEILKRLRWIRRQMAAARRNAARGAKTCRLYHQAHQAAGRAEAYAAAEAELKHLIRSI